MTLADAIIKRVRAARAKLRPLYAVHGAKSGRNLGGQPDSSCRRPDFYWAKRGRTGWWRACERCNGATAIRVVVVRP